MTEAWLAPATARAIEAAGLDVPGVVRTVRAALDEDFRYGADVTSVATVSGRSLSAEVVAREAGVVAGLPVALAVLDLLSDYVAASGGPGGLVAGTGSGRALVAT
jgi:nicotinate-nucleotide pyrophosphorylase (carboxylating)